MAEGRPHFQHGLRQVTPHRPPGSLVVLNTLRGTLSRELGRRPRPTGRERRGAGVSVGVSSGARPSVPAITPRSARSSPAGRDARLVLVGLAEGCCCGDSGGLRGSGGTTFTRLLRGGSVELRCPRGRRGLGAGDARASPGRTQLLTSPSLSRTWTARACGWGFCCPWWSPWISDITTRKGWRRS